MRKTLFWLAASLFLFSLPVFAQGHGNHGGGNRGNGGGHEQRGGGERHAQSQPRHDNNGRNVQRDNHNDRRAEQRFHQNNDRRGYHNAEPRGEFRRHWDGRRFDHEFFERHWGRDHRFYWGHCGWYGPRFYVGSYFWFDGAYFEIVDTIPSYWYDDDVAVIYDEDCGCYYVIDPVYPGVRIHVGIRF